VEKCLKSLMERIEANGVDGDERSFASATLTKVERKNGDREDDSEPSEGESSGHDVFKNCLALRELIEKRRKFPVKAKHGLLLKRAESAFHKIKERAKEQAVQLMHLAEDDHKQILSDSCITSISFIETAIDRTRNVLSFTKDFISRENQPNLLRLEAELKDVGQKLLSHVISDLKQSPNLYLCGIDTKVETAEIYAKKTGNLDAKELFVLKNIQSERYEAVRKALRRQALQKLKQQIVEISKEANITVFVEKANRALVKTLKKYSGISDSAEIKDVKLLIRSRVLNYLKKVVTEEYKELEREKQAAQKGRRRTDTNSVDRRERATRILETIKFVKQTGLKATSPDMLKAYDLVFDVQFQPRNLLAVPRQAAALPDLSTVKALSRKDHLELEICRHTYFMDGEEEMKCVLCDGTGEIREKKYSSMYEWVTSSLIGAAFDTAKWKDKFRVVDQDGTARCWICQGSGEMRKWPCTIRVPAKNQKGETNCNSSGNESSRLSILCCQCESRESNYGISVTCRHEHRFCVTCIRKHHIAAWHSKQAPSCPKCDQDSKDRVCNTLDTKALTFLAQRQVISKTLQSQIEKMVISDSNSSLRDTLHCPGCCGHRLFKRCKSTSSNGGSLDIKQEDFSTVVWETDREQKKKTNSTHRVGLKVIPVRCPKCSIIICPGCFTGFDDKFNYFEHECMVVRRFRVLFVRVPEREEQVRYGPQSLRPSRTKTSWKEKKDAFIRRFKSTHKKHCFETIFQNELQYCGNYVAVYHVYCKSAILYELNSALAHVLLGWTGSSPLPRLHFQPFVKVVEVAVKV